jgi:hypothetical protein
MRWISLSLVIISAVVLSVPVANAAVPGLINYQGILTDESGAPLSGTYQLTFSIYPDSAQSAIAAWSEQHLSVAVESGIFRVVLGSVSLLSESLFAGDECWLGVAVGASPEMYPRQRLVSVPWALRAAVADSAATVGTAVGSAWTVDGDNIYSSVSGNAGIGNTSPLVKLHVTRTGQSMATDALGGEEILVEDADAVLGLYSGPNGNNGSVINLGEINGGVFTNKWSLVRATGSAPSLRFNYGTNANYADNDPVMTMLSNGNVGIGTTAPARKLEVGCDTAAAHVRISTSNYYGPVLELQSTQVGAPTLGRIQFLNSAGSDVASMVYYADPPLTLDPGLYYYAGGNCRLFISTTTGMVGIGKATAGEMLDVAGVVKAEVLKLTGGADIAEPFDIGVNEEVDAGMVVGIDPDQPGKLKVCDRPYDRCVAGITSGAGGVDPGLIMGQEGTVAHGGHPVALTGRVYCWADASQGPIEPGDLLTSSEVPGHAMKVTDFTKAQGAVIGKAMSSLESGRGLVLVLVTLQ